jgi:hypothetical protein
MSGTDDTTQDDVVDETSVDDTDGTDAGSDTQQDDDKPLGPAGEKAYQAEKEKRRAAQAELRQWKALGLTPDQIRELQKAGGKQTDGDTEVDLDKLRADARAEAQAEALRGRVEDKIEAKAHKFADPEDAVATLLRKHGIDEFIDGSKVDVDAITEALDDLLKSKPYLAAQGGKRFQGGGDGGARKESRPAQLTKADVQRLSKEGKSGAAEIEKARKEGRLDDLLSGKST